MAAESAVSRTGGEHRAETDHRRGDQAVQHPPGRGLGEETAEQAGAEAECGEPAQAGADGAESKVQRSGPRAAAMEPSRKTVSR